MQWDASCRAHAPSSCDAHPMNRVRPPLFVQERHKPHLVADAPIASTTSFVRSVVALPLFPPYHSPFPLPFPAARRGHTRSTLAGWPDIPHPTSETAPL